VAGMPWAKAVVAAVILILAGACSSSPRGSPPGATSSSPRRLAVPTQKLPELRPGVGEFGEPKATLTAAPLPAMPAAAPAYVVSGTVTAAQVDRLAAAVGARGTPNPQGGVEDRAWVLQSPTTWLSVEPSGLGRWLFQQIPPSPLCAPEWADTWCAGGALTPMTTSSAESVARQALAAAGMDLSGARVAETAVEGGVLVMFTPVYGGLPVAGLDAAVNVGDGGSVRQASGFLGIPTMVGTYPLVTPTAAVQRLDAGEVLPRLNAGDVASVCDLLPGSGCGSAPPGVPPATQIHSLRLALAPAVPFSPAAAVLEPAFTFDATPEVVPAAVGAALMPEGLEGEPGPGVAGIGFSLPAGPQPVPAAGNGLGPGGECTGRETVPPCGPGMAPGRYYSYTVPSACGGKLVADGRLWDPELPLPSAMRRQEFWISVRPDGGGVFGPGGAVGFTAAAGATSTCAG
jgi:hypothetical protein